LKLWVGGILAAKGTRNMHNIPTGQEEYTPRQREADFKGADNYAIKNEIFRAGVEVCTILELMIRHHPQISLAKAALDSSTRRYVLTIVGGYMY
jgi:hypothetical protein